MKTAQEFLLDEVKFNVRTDQVTAIMEEYHKYKSLAMRECLQGFINLLPLENSPESAELNHLLNKAKSIIDGNI